MIDTVCVGETNIAYRTWGEASAPPMILLHGLGEDHTTWSAAAPELAVTHRVHALDLRGHGASGRCEQYSFEGMRDDLLGFMDALGLERATVVGHSIGGMPGWLVAQERPDRLVALVSIECPPPRGDLTRPVPPRPERPLPFDWAVVESAVRQINRPRAEWWDRLAEVRVPALVLAGGSTSNVPQALMGQVAAAVPQARLVEVPGGHHLHRDRSQEFVAAVRAFLADVC